MPLEIELYQRLKRFVGERDLRNGLLALDLDGTALLEDQGRVFISGSVEKGVRAIHDLNLPVVLNTLRFPLSVISTVGEAWYQIADVPILTVLLNGSVLGYIRRNNGNLEYHEIAAFPLQRGELDKMLEGVAELVKAGIEDILLFFYTRDWRAGETVWTPQPSHVEGLQKKYVSAARVISCSVEELQLQLHQTDVCMTSLLVDRPEDTLMAYQHSKRNSFFTTAGIDKASGLREIAAHLERSLVDSFGAGDTEMDNFLSELGLAIIVGNAPLPYRGTTDTVRVATPLELGEVIFGLAELVESTTVA